MQKNQGIIDILNRLHADIRALEEEFGLRFGGSDFRPRIDYFHEAVEAYAAGGIPAERLNVEKLAYDVEALRYLHTTPLGELQPGGRRRSPSQEVARMEEGALTANRRPDRETKARLSELYQQYGVLFAALLKPAADADYADRSETLYANADEMAAVLAQAGAGRQALIDSAAHIEDTRVRTDVIALLKAGKTQEALALMKAAKQRNDHDLREIDRAHGQYVMAQLGIYEQGRDVVKQLAARGMNLAGHFVENAMAQAVRDAARSR